MDHAVPRRHLTLADEIAEAAAHNAFRARGQEDDRPDTLLPPLLDRLAATEAGELSFVLAMLAADDLGDLAQIRAVVEAAADWAHQRTGAADHDTRLAAEDAWGHLTAAAEALDTARVSLDNAAALAGSWLPDAPAPPRRPIRLRPAQPEASQHVAREPSPAALGIGIGISRTTPAIPAQPGRPPVPRADAPHR